VKKEAAGLQTVTADVELIASVPFALSTSGEETENGITWTLSTFDLDRFGERIDPAGWDYKRYMDNPVVEWAHRALPKINATYWAPKAAGYNSILCEICTPVVLSLTSVRQLCAIAF
jgi:hypothetical protein